MRRIIWYTLKILSIPFYAVYCLLDYLAELTGE